MDVYLSPLHFLPEGTDIKDISSKQLLLAKKKLLAEIELSPTKTIILNKVVCTQNDLLNLFNDLSQNEKQLHYHFAIFNNRALLEFLENRFVGILPVALENNLLEDKIFIDFISPYFEKVYASLFIKCIKQLRIASINVLIANSYLMNYADRDKSDKAIEHYLDKDIKQILIYTQKINTQKRISFFYPLSILNLFNLFIPKNYRVSELKQYYNSTLIAILNVLPEKFSSIRTEYCRVVMNMAVGLQRHDSKLALSILKKVRVLKCSDSMHQKVESNYRIMSPKLKFGRLFLYLIAAFIILRILGFLIALI